MNPGRFSCPLGTGYDRCEWQASGTTGEDDVARRGSHGLQLQRRGRSVQGDTSLVGKRSTGGRGSSCAKAIATTDPGHPDPSVIARNVRNGRVDL
jgi:hypothetical protein